MDKLWLEKERILNEVMNSLEEKYPSGLYDWLYIHDRALYARINEIENALNECFAEGRSVEGFKATLRGYWDAHMKGIRQFRARKENALTFPEVRAERIAERECARV